MQKVRPCLWFNGQAEEAAEFYTTIFRNSRITDVTNYPEGSPGEPGTVMTVDFEVEGQEFMGLNGGPEFSFTPATSFMVECADQGYVDDVWEKLSSGGEPMECGWVTDRFGVTWQIIPKGFLDLIMSDDQATSQKAFNAMLTMVKLDINELRRAVDS